MAVLCLEGEDLLFAVSNLGSKKIAVIVVGWQYRNGDGQLRQKIIPKLKKGLPVWLRREPENEWDRNAVAVYASIGQVGYVPRDVATVLAKVLDGGASVDAEILQVERNKGEKAWIATIAIWADANRSQSKAGVEEMIGQQYAQASAGGWLSVWWATIRAAFSGKPVQRSLSKFEAMPHRLAALGPGVVQRVEVIGENGHNEDGSSRQKILAKVRKGAKVTLQREEGNPFDKTSIAVFVGSKQVGHVHPKPAKVLAKEMDEGAQFHAEVSEVRGGTAQKPSFGVWLYVHKLD